MFYKKTITVLSIFSLICLINIFPIVNISMAKFKVNCHANCGDHIVICGSETGVCSATENVGCAIIAGGILIVANEC